MSLTKIINFSYFKFINQKASEDGNILAFMMLRGINDLKPREVKANHLPMRSLVSSVPITHYSMKECYIPSTLLEVAMPPPYTVRRFEGFHAPTWVARSEEVHVATGKVVVLSSGGGI